MSTSMRVLVVEDSPTQAAEVRAILEDVGCEVELAGTLAEALGCLKGGRAEAVLLDLGLPDAAGLDVVGKVRAAAPELPVVVLTGLEDEATALRAVQGGAQDYLFKGRLDGDLLIRSMRYAVERQRAEGALRRSRDDLLTILNELRTGTLLTDADGRVTFTSSACTPFLRRGRKSGGAVSWADLLPLDGDSQTRLHDMLARPPGEREKVAVNLQARSGYTYCLDIEVHDDPQDSARKIFCLYDMSEVRDLRRLLDERASFQDLVGKSAPMLKVYELIRQVACVDATVVIEGETGTGKELVARAIHSLSPRHLQPFVTVNAAGLTDSLLASQLFGHRRGAFTGAVDEHKGFFETAHGGTLLLDEIGDVSENVQTSLLRVLQEREIFRVGDSRPCKVDVRFLAATHRDLSEAVAEGTFRADLFYRIRVARIHLPPLRERREDIPLLVASFLDQFRASTRKPIESVSESALATLMAYPWPGNVRELRGAVEFAVIGCAGNVLDLGDLPPEVAAAHPARKRKRPVPRTPEADAERERLLAALAKAGGNRTAAAKRLGMARATFYRRLGALGIGAD